MVRVLIIEDDYGLQTALTRALRKMNPDINIEWVSSADEALGLLGNTDLSTDERYDLIISDIFLPGKLSGLQLWEACEATRQSTPVLLMSGMGVEEFFRAIGRNTIAPPFLPKPFALGEFTQITESLLHGARRYTAAA